MQDGGSELGAPSIGNKGVWCRYVGALSSSRKVALRVRSQGLGLGFGDCMGRSRESVPPVSHQLHAWHNRPVMLQNLCQVPSEASAPLLHEGPHLKFLLATESDDTGFQSGFDLIQAVIAVPGRSPCRWQHFLSRTRVISPFLGDPNPDLAEGTAGCDSRRAILDEELLEVCGGCGVLPPLAASADPEVGSFLRAVNSAFQSVPHDCLLVAYRDCGHYSVGPHSFRLSLTLALKLTSRRAVAR